MMIVGDRFVVITLSLTIIMALILYPVMSAGICKKCVNRDFALYTDGSEFYSGEEITVRLMNIGDKTQHINVIQVYLVVGNETIFLDEIEANLELKPRGFYEFKFVAPDVEQNKQAYLKIYLDDLIVESNDFIIRPDGYQGILYQLDRILSLLTIILIIIIGYKYYLG